MGITPRRVEFLDEQAEPLRNEEKLERIKDSLESISVMLSWAREELTDFALQSSIGAHVVWELENQQKALAENIEILNEIA